MRSKNGSALVSGLLIVVLMVIFITLTAKTSSSSPPLRSAPVSHPFLSDPFLQAPTPHSVQVVWFTEFEGTEHRVNWGHPGQATTAESRDLPHQTLAVTTQLSRAREDARSHLNHSKFTNVQETVFRSIWRHEATVTGLSSGQRVPYRVSSRDDLGTWRESRTFSLAATPRPGQALKILLTSDHQNMPMTAANLQKVQETVGRVDAVFVAGDLVNIPDRASEWFDDSRGNGFFPCLQGRATYDLERNGSTTRYQGGELIQHAPLFAALGNHEVMGRFSRTASLNEQFGNPVPRAVATGWYEDQADLFNPRGDESLRQQWITNHAFNTQTYDEIFSLPVSPIPNSAGAKSTSHYYAVNFGDIRLVTLYVTQIWRSYGLAPTIRGRYQEREVDLGTPQNWGYGQHIFEPIERGSVQYQWLEQELASDAFRNAKFKVVMFHHPPHTLGDNIVPPFTTPVPVYDRNPDGSLKAIRYEYPMAADYIARDLIPLLETAGVDLVFFGHSHLWNRFISPAGTHYLETSNVGNSYGAFWKDRSRPIPPTDPLDGLEGFTPSNYIAQGDPNGLEPSLPSLVAPLTDDAGQPLPYLASNDITAFSILETAKGTVSSYYFDTRQPESAVVKFDQFPLKS